MENVQRAYNNGVLTYTKTGSDKPYHTIIYSLDAVWDNAKAEAHYYLRRQSTQGDDYDSMIVSSGDEEWAKRTAEHYHIDYKKPGEIDVWE